MSDKATMREQILDTASQLVQTRGYHAFSYADIAEEVGIRKASIHYHFPSKTDLGKALVSRYREHFRDSVAHLAYHAHGADEQLQRYAQLFRAILRGMGPQDAGRICLCGVLAAEWPGLPQIVREEVKGFFTENEAWLAGVMEQGRASGVLHFQGTAAIQAAAFLAGLEGAMLLARARQDILLYCAVAHQLLAQQGLEALDVYSLDTTPALPAIA